MDRKVIAGLVVVVIVAVAGAVFFVGTGDGKSSKNDHDHAVHDADTKLTAVKACDLLTLTEAKQLMGDATTAGSNTAPASSDDIKVDNCSYSNNATSVPAIRTATIMVRSALTHDGHHSNEEAFDAGGVANPSGATAVEGYGEKAVWDPASHQLAILKGNTWIGIVYGGTNPANNTLDDAKKVADLVVN